MTPVALFVTYTMLEPIVGGAFFRALRLACEMHDRGWSPIICNSGPMLDDPKVAQARGAVRFMQLDCHVPGFDRRAACRQFKALEPDVVIMGETPFETMKVFYDGARMVRRPFVVLDQFYHAQYIPDPDSADLILLYGLKSFWPRGIHLEPPYVLVPPFIESVTPKSDLPVSTHLHAYPWVTLVAYESEILQSGIDLLAGLGAPSAAFIVVSPDPQEAEKLLRRAGVDLARTALLPLQGDPHVFGLYAASRVTIVSSGFLQIMEALAMGSPVIALARRGGGMGPAQVVERFWPFVSLVETREQQRGKLEKWLRSSPFTPPMLEHLKNERGGAQRCADEIEALVRQRNAGTGLRRKARQRLPHLRWARR